MRTKAFQALVAVSLLLSACGKKDNGLGPGNVTPLPDIGAYKVLPHGVAVSLPATVNIFFNVVDTAGTPVPQLTTDRFTVIENGTPVSHTTSAMTILKRSNMDYRFKTVLMLDASSAAPLEAVKTAARAFTAMIDPRQTVAVYRFSDRPELLQNFSGDAVQLSAAIDAMTAGPVATRNLFNTVNAGVALFEEQYSPASALQFQIVVFSAGNDTRNDAAKKEETIYTSGFGNVYMIGLGNDLDADFFSRTGNRGFFRAADAGALTEAFMKTESSIIRLADSYYRLVYTSTLRGNAEQGVQLMVNGNLYDGQGSTINATFNSKDLVSVRKGLYVNWTPNKPRGVDTLIIGAAVSQKAVALSMGGEKYPVFRWSSPEPQVLKVEPVGEGLGEAFLTTVTEGITRLVVEDIANSASDTVVVRAVQSYDGFVLREWWENVPGTTINDLTSSANYPDNPNSRVFLNKLETPTNFKDNYGQRLRGYILPPASGSYTFWIASDDISKLYLSTDENPANKIMIAGVNTYTGGREYTKEPNQHSAVIQLESGKSYYIEVLHKEGGGGDLLSVAWDGPGITRTEIAGQYLSAWLGN
jgi:hypothetical protein